MAFNFADAVEAEDEGFKHRDVTLRVRTCERKSARWASSPP
jgi:hypothetical protein